MKSTYTDMSALANLRTYLESANDRLVETENALTADGDMAEFTALHEHLDGMIEIVGDLEWRASEGELGDTGDRPRVTLDHTYTAAPSGKTVYVYHVYGATNRDAALRAIPGDFLVYADYFDSDDNRHRVHVVRTF